MESFETLMIAAAARQAEERRAGRRLSFARHYRHLGTVAERQELADQTQREALWIAEWLVHQRAESFTALPVTLYDQIQSRYPEPRLPSRGLGGGDWSHQQINSRDREQSRREGKISTALEKAAKGDQALQIWDINSTYSYDVPVTDMDEPDTSYRAERIHVVGVNNLYTVPSKPQKGTILPASVFYPRTAEESELHGIRDCLADLAVRILPPQQ